MQKKEKIIIATGIYPPQIGGPAIYSFNLAEELRRKNFDVKILNYKIENFLPTGVRHFVFFLKLTFSVFNVKTIIALDTFSVGFPSVIVGIIFRKKVIIRTGGDFLWEGYVERTGKKVLFSKFYDNEFKNLSFKERIIFKLTGFTLRNCFKVVFSTTWQRDIFIRAYGLNFEKTSIIENEYLPPEQVYSFTEKTFLGSTRKLKWKNIDTLEIAFSSLKKDGFAFDLDVLNYKHEDFLLKIKDSYAVILVSLGDISPNMILDSIRCSKPFILTKENGLFDRIKDIGIFVDPLDGEDIKLKILWLSKEENYRAQVKKIKSFTFRHSYEDIASEFLNLIKSK